MAIDMYNFNDVEDPDFVEYQVRFLDSIGICLQK